MTQNEAKLIENLGRLALNASGIRFISVHSKSWLESRHEIREFHQFEMAELDLMYPTNLAISLFNEPEVEKEHIFLGDLILVVERGQISEKVTLPCWKFTAIGAELLPLVPPSENEPYLEQIGLFFSEKKGRASIAKVTERLSDGIVKYDVLREIKNPDGQQPNSTTSRSQQ